MTSPDPPPADTTPPPPPRPAGARAPLSDRQRATLKELRWFTDSADRDDRRRKWARPMDVGGYNGSHHGATLMKLREMGLAEAQVYRIGVRRTFYYRITDKGRAALAGGIDT